MYDIILGSQAAYSHTLLVQLDHGAHASFHTISA